MVKFNKANVIKYCKEVASQHDDWTFTSGFFVKKLNKWLHIKVDPRLYFWPQGTKNMAGAVLSLPLFERSLLKEVFGERDSYTFQANNYGLRKNSLIESSLFANDGSCSIALAKQEMTRWLAECEAAVAFDYDITSEDSIFNSVCKLIDMTFTDQKSVKLCVYAAYLGKFDFVEQHFMPYIQDTSKRKSEAEVKFAELLPEFKGRWQKTGSAIKPRKTVYEARV
ncbi:hypothetical protein [Algibacillus agarilyticus]|uniref:hypothetical protein n=1 Tax=Algibacillus agarilyticus TaxID=2234133 RepID=UPI000DD03638|nr:hypothetical protein [Algibacillus agarilyticus]